VRQGHAEAVRWYRKAAEQGFAGGQGNLGVLYDHGQGVKQGHAEAVHWYRKATEQGLVNAVAALKRLSAGAVTSNASPSALKAIVPATRRACSSCGIGERGGGAANKPCSRGGCGRRERDAIPRRVLGGPGRHSAAARPRGPRPARSLLQARDAAAL